MNRNGLSAAARMAAAGLWAGLVVWAFIPGGATHDDTGRLIVSLATFDTSTAGGVTAAIFNAMGLYPFLFAALLYADPRFRKSGRSMTVTLIASFAAGAFVLLPYFAIARLRSGRAMGRRLIRFGESRITAAILSAAAAGLIALAASGGYAQFAVLFQSNLLVRVMSADFLALTIYCPVLALTDPRAGGRRYLSLIPLIGPALFLLLRPTPAAP